MATFVSFNINGIRSRPHQLEAIKAKYDPEVIGIQESKVADEAFPLTMVQGLSYQAHYHGQKGHYGVALLSKATPLAVCKGFPTDGEEAQRRAITGRFTLPDGEAVTVVNGYFPQGESRDHPVKFPGKAKFYADLSAYLSERHRPNEPLIVMGDMNVAPADADVGIGDDNARRWLRSGKCSFLPEERDWLRSLMDWGLLDAYRLVHPDVTDRFSWFDYRSRGFEREPKRGLRIDLILITEPLRRRLRDAGIDYDIRALEKPSDHCPVWIDLA
ncbi:exodeoxyribonuclease III [uncultured Thiohalocapsa sp.]|uniref:exodeoxyribonuclease III n=1 Tax=uncultured Thiohalocapsa sp. TaxID=768990 RepID=UPI0025EB3BD8|nr:exodeoxyribonuclease III [uncultured Thiohalocapsa sp.]